MPPRKRQPKTYDDGWLPVDTPASSWALLIGKGGATVQALQEQFGVWVRIPRVGEAGEAAIVWVSGGDETNRQACAERIRAIVDGTSRGKDRQSIRAQQASTASAKNMPFPATCPLCKVHLNGVPTVFDHLGSVRHHEEVVKKLGAAVGPAFGPAGPQHAGRGAQGGARVRTAGAQESTEPSTERSADPSSEGRPAPLAVAQLLETDADYRALHEELGFDAAWLVGAAEAEEQRRAAARELQRQVQRLPEDSDWLRVEGRSWICWDDSVEKNEPTLSCYQAPPLADMLARVFLLEDAASHNKKKLPPVVHVPGQLPAALPRVDPRLRKGNRLKQEGKYPAAPTSGRLALAAMSKMGLSLEDFDVVCGTAFLKALAGDNSITRDTFYLQRAACSDRLGARWQRSLCVLHVPRRRHTVDDAGHAVERLLCGKSGEGSFQAVTRLFVGETRFLVASEVDATDGAGSWVEVKSSGAKTSMAQLVSAKMALQVAINGSAYVLACFLNKDKSHLERAEWLHAAELLDAHKAGLVAFGQRVRLLLPRILEHELLRSEAAAWPAVVRLTFDDSKAPVLEPAGHDLPVLPEGLLC